MEKCKQTASVDIDLAEYDQVDEAKFFMEHQAQMGGRAGSDLLTTLSSERPTSIESTTNCENDFVFLPSPNTMKPLHQLESNTEPSAVTDSTKQQQANMHSQTQQQEAGDTSKQVEAAVKIITPDQLDIRSHKRGFSYAANALGPTGTATIISRTKEQNQPITRPDFVFSSTTQHRVTNPLMTINPNVGSNNPFYSLQQVSPGGGGAASNGSIATGQAGQPFLMRAENFVTRWPIGLLPAPTTSTNSFHLSDLLQQIVTKSDSIFIAIPCVFCNNTKAYPPSDISAWLAHMDRAHNCKPCPTCNRLVGLGPMRDIEIMRKHVVDHIDDDWLKGRSAKASFTFGLQQQWFSSGLCSVKDPKTLDRSKH